MGAWGSPRCVHSACSNVWTLCVAWQQFALHRVTPCCKHSLVSPAPPSICRRGFLCRWLAVAATAVEVVVWGDHTLLSPSACMCAGAKPAPVSAAAAAGKPTPAPAPAAKTASAATTASAAGTTAPKTAPATGAPSASKAAASKPAPASTPASTSVPAAPKAVAAAASAPATTGAAAKVVTAAAAAAAAAPPVAAHVRCTRCAFPTHHAAQVPVYYPPPHPATHSEDFPSFLAQLVVVPFC